jgi:RimJ/RimL family protein N-acetyltransferase
MRVEQIETARLRLRRPRVSDLDDLHALLSDPRVMRYWSTPEHETPEQTTEWLAGMMDPTQADSDDFLVEHQGRIVGKAGAWRLPEVGFLIHPDLWGKGLAREAMTAAISYLFAQHGIDSLTAEVDPRNSASIGLLIRLGFMETHRAERTMQWRDEWCDSVYFALKREDWLARQSVRP